MRLTRDQVVAQALDILDSYGFADLTMRRVAGALGVAPGALYWHVANKQTLLLAVAEEILAPLCHDDGTTPVDWRAAVHGWAQQLRAALLAHRDGAEVVASALALRPVDSPAADLGRVPTQALTTAGFGLEQATAGALGVQHFVVGHCLDVQTNAQARALGVPVGENAEAVAEDRFAFALALLLDGMGARLAHGSAR